MNLLKQLLFCDNQGNVSHTRFWSNIGYFLICIFFASVTNVMLRKSDFNATEWVEILLAFGAVVAVPNGFSKWLGYKTRIATQGSQETTVSDEKGIKCCSGK